MAEKRTESSVLFSLRDLRAFGPEAPSRAPARPDRVEALDLLADVRASVSEQARFEAEARSAAETERRDEADRRLRAATAAHLADIEARVAAEDTRRRVAAEERTLRSVHDASVMSTNGRTEGRMSPSDRSGAAHPGAADASTSLARLDSPTAQSAQAPRPPLESEPFAPAAPARGRTAFFAIVVGLPVACVTAVALALVVRDRGATLPEGPATPESAVAVAPSSRSPSASVARPAPALASTTVASRGPFLPDVLVGQPPARVDARPDAKPRKPPRRPRSIPSREPSREPLRVEFGGD